MCHGGAANPVNSFGGNVRDHVPNGLTYAPGVLKPESPNLPRKKTEPGDRQSNECCSSD